MFVNRVCFGVCSMMMVCMDMLIDVASVSFRYLIIVNSADRSKCSNNDQLVGKSNVLRGMLVWNESNKLGMQYDKFGVGHLTVIIVTDRYRLPILVVKIHPF